VVGCCECGDEPSGSCTTELVGSFYRTHKKPLLTSAMRRKCVAWAKEYVKWTAVQWDSVIFSDPPRM
jgi:hypothetical protein